MHQRRGWPALAVGAGAVLIVAGAWWEGDRAWPTGAARVSVAATIAGVVVTALVAGRGRQRTTSARWARGTVEQLATARPLYRAGAAVWAFLVAAAVAWDLVSFTAASHRLPTFSRLAGDLTGHPAGRAVAAAAWLLVGLALARRTGRPPAGDEPDPGPRPGSR